MCKTTRTPQNVRASPADFDNLASTVNSLVLATGGSSLDRATDMNSLTNMIKLALD